MSVCPSCGFRNPGSDPFCRNPACGSFLGWGQEQTGIESRPPLRIDSAADRPDSAAADRPGGDRPDSAGGTSTGGGGNGDDTQPFDTAAEAHRPDPPSEAHRPDPPGAAPAPGAGGTRPSGVRSALGTSAAAPPRRPTAPTDSEAARGGPTGAAPAPNGATGRPGGAEGVVDGTGAGAAPDRPGSAGPAGPAGGPVPPARTFWFDQDETWRRPAAAAPWPKPAQPGPEPTPQPASRPTPQPAPKAGWGPVHQSWKAAPEGARLVLPPATVEPPAPERYSSFPTEAELLKRPPLWERLLRRLPVPMPGEGPLRRAPSVRYRERQRALLRFGGLVAVIALIGGGLWLASLRGRSATTGAGPGGTVATPALVRLRPSGVVASTQSGSRLASNVIDGKLGTFWSRLAPSQDNQPFLQFSFDHPVELGRLAIAGGASGSQFSKRPRPQEIELVFSDGTSLRTTMADRPGFQTVTFSPRQVDHVRLVVLSTYPSPGAQRTSISEVRFYRVKG